MRIRWSSAFPLAGAIVALACGGGDGPANNNNNNNETPAFCGDGNADPGEDCDGDDLRGQTCVNLGYNLGELRCFGTCDYNFSFCSRCGDGMAEGTDPGQSHYEPCDTDDLRGETCLTQTGMNGPLVCDAACQLDTAQCTLDPNCGNGVIDANETCDGSNFGGESCLTRGLGYNGGQLTCPACQIDDAFCFNCGNGTCEAFEPAQDCPAECGVVEVCASDRHSCAVVADGSVRCMGFGDEGQLGDGASTSSAIPLPVAGLAAAAVQVGCGGRHTCALLADGSVHCWGINLDGQLGDGSNAPSPVPVMVAGLTGVTELSVGDRHNCAVLGSGDVACWGRNFFGQLGDGTTIDSPSPVQVSGITGAVAVGAGGFHSCARLADNNIWCWGDNFHGQLGDNTNDNTLVPVIVWGLADKVALAVGIDHTCAVYADTSVRCWGRNDDRQLGDGTIDARNTPTAVSGLTGAAGVAAGNQHSCARMIDGTAQCWGWNADGQLGDGTNFTSSAPVVVSGLAGAVDLVAGYSHNCARLGDQTARCWGRNADGQIGDGTQTNAMLPVQPQSL